MRKLSILWIVITAFALQLTAGVNADLEEAYKKEYAFLVAQKKVLEERLASVKQEAKGKISKAEETIAKLQDTYIAKTTLSERKAQQLSDAERDMEGVKDNSSLTEATLLQAQTTLEKYGFKPEAKTKPFQQVEYVYAYADKTLKTLYTVRKENGSFYLEDGSKAEGHIIKVGNIAAYGISAKYQGALAPAGEGNYKLWKDPVGDFNEKLTQGGGHIELFIYESLDKEVEAKKDKSALDVIQSGGTVAWVIVLLGLFALVLVGLRISFLKKASASTDEVTEDVSSTLKNSTIHEALERCGQYRNATSRVLAATIRNLDRDREHLEDIISESILHENSYLDRFGSMIIIIAAVAPLLGLLGTVTGMISTFDIITEFGTGDPKMLSGGISEALVTTELGLIVAIPALIFGNLLSGWAENIKNDMEKAALRVTNIYKKTKEA